MERARIDSTAQPSATPFSSQMARRVVRWRAVAHAVGSMKLAEKGRYVPPPQLEPAAQRVAETIAQWAGVHARSHWLLGDERVVDGADFYYGEDELGHIHLDSQAHVVLARPVVEDLIKAGQGRRFPWSAEVVAFDIKTQRDVTHALWLFELSYDRRRGAESAHAVHGSRRAKSVGERTRR